MTLRKTPEGWCIARDKDLHERAYPTKAKAMAVLDKILSGLVQFKPAGRYYTTNN